MYEWTVVVLSILLYMYMHSTPELPKVQDIVNQKYDYIIVGGGSAGSVLAHRLSEKPDSTVLLLEAGGLVEENPDIDDPAAVFTLLDSKYDWALKTVPQRHAFMAMEERRSFMRSGRVLGGSSSINMLGYTRGSRYDYDSWTDEGCDGWSYNDVLPYFIKSEDCQIEEHFDSRYRSKDGHLHVSSWPYYGPLRDKYLQAAKELGYNEGDYNGYSQIGFHKMQSTVKNKKRWSAYNAFLKPAMTRQNLHVSINSVATKIIVEKQRTKGVTFIKDGRKQTVLAKKEVILSAGAVNSPKLLMLSGIGPKQHLLEMGVNTIADLPVGKYLQNHLMTLMNYDLNLIHHTTSNNGPLAYIQNALMKAGLLSPVVGEGVGFLYKDNTTYDKGVAPDIQVHFVSFPMLTPAHRDLKLFNYNEQMKDKVFTQSPNTTSLLILPVLLHPKSRGSVRLQSTDPLDPPLIDPNYLDDKEDVDILVKSIEHCERLAGTTALGKLGVSVHNASPLYKICTEFKLKSREYWECYVRHHSITVYHPTSTCRMGAIGDKTAVVDPRLRVHGIKGLRVADASVMRNSPSGNTNAPAIMIGEKAADMIKQDDKISRQ